MTIWLCSWRPFSATDASQRHSDTVTGFAPSGWRNLRTQGQRQTWLDGAEAHSVEYVLCDQTAVALVGPIPTPDADGLISTDTRRRVSVRLLMVAESELAIELDGRRQVVSVILDGNLAHVGSQAGARTFVAAERFEVHDADEGGSGPICPLPGTVIAVHVSAGQQVSDGDVLMVVEAMKMEHKITATTDATVSEVRFAVGDRVDQGDLLVELEAQEK